MLLIWLLFRFGTELQTSTLSTKAQVAWHPAFTLRKSPEVLTRLWCELLSSIRDGSNLEGRKVFW